ncbi:MAG TPA: helix-turn-helix domain-containing protein [Acidimicrobiia bacterium]|nr:helix-turn-helix domain-containing protein [Acidimicrobiia bacterium]
MKPRKSYGQFCALARALDRVGDRWTLLVVRELLLGPQTFRDLRARLPGMSPSLLVDRLDALGDDGLVERNAAPARSKSVEYRLTEQGASLEPVVHELIRWGARWMVTGPGSDQVEPSWGVLALRALIETAPSPDRRSGAVHLDLGDAQATVTVRRGERSVSAGQQGRPRATISASLPSVLAVAAGFRTFSDAGLDVDGDATLAAVALAPA